MTITIIPTIRIKEVKMEEAIEALKNAVPIIKEAESGCLAYVPHTIKRRKKKNTIVFYEKYKKDAALKLHTYNLGKSI
ncbi:MAG: putative quinol monooxygenase [Promethearchaeota archaeon]